MPKAERTEWAKQTVDDDKLQEFYEAEDLVKYAVERCNNTSDAKTNIAWRVLLQWAIEEF